MCDNLSMLTIEKNKCCLYWVVELWISEFLSEVTEAHMHPPPHQSEGNFSLNWVSLWQQHDTNQTSHLVFLCDEKESPIPLRFYTLDYVSIIWKQKKYFSPSFSKTLNEIITKSLNTEIFIILNGHLLYIIVYCYKVKNQNSHIISVYCKWMKTSLKRHNLNHFCLQQKFCF